MPKFDIVFEREVVVKDRIKRTIEAPSREEALAKAVEMAVEFNSDCPDDTEEVGSAECDDWCVTKVDPEKASA